MDGAALSASRRGDGPGGPSDPADYTRRAVTLLQRLELLLDRIHERGIVYGDLHPRNILVGDDEQVSLVDFELGCDVDLPVSPGLGAPGFTAPADRTGLQVDRYALAAVRLFLFLPLNAVLAMAPAKAAQYIATVDRRFPLPAGFTDDVRRSASGLLLRHDEPARPAPDRPTRHTATTTTTTAA